MSKQENINRAAFDTNFVLFSKITKFNKIASFLHAIRQRGNTEALKTINSNLIVFSNRKVATESNVEKFISISEIDNAINKFEGSTMTINFDNEAINSIVSESIESLETSQKFINMQNLCITELQANVDKHLLLYFGNITTINKIIASIESNTKSIKWWQFLKLHRSKKNILENVARLQTLNAEIYSSTASMKYANDGAINTFTNENV